MSRQLTDDVRVLWAEQQFAKRRQKRGYVPDYPPFETEESTTSQDNRPLIRVKRESSESKITQFPNQNSSIELKRMIIEISR